MDTRRVRANSAERIAVGILVIIIFLFLALCCFGAFGGVGRAVKGFWIGFFGLAGYAYSLVGVIVGGAVTCNLRVRRRFTSYAKYLLLFVLGVYALQIYTSSPQIVAAPAYGDYLTTCYATATTAGGMLYGIAAWPIMRALTSVGALVIVCVLFFLVAFFSIYPFVKKNVTYRTSASTVNDAKERFTFNSLFKRGDKGARIEPAKAPALTDFSSDKQTGGQQLYMVDVDAAGTPFADKKAKGASGYNPLYPNAGGTIEDDEKVQPMTDEFSAQKLARDILFNGNTDKSNIEKFNLMNNPETALKNPGAPYSAARRAELMSKLGIEPSPEERNEAFMSRYRTDEPSTEIPRGNEVEAKAYEMPEAVTETAVEDVVPRREDGTPDFFALKDDQTKRFKELYAERDSQEEKKEVVQPTRKVQKPEFGVATVEETPSKMAGLRGAVNRAISGEELVPPKTKPEEVVAVGYDVSDAATVVVNDEYESSAYSKPERKTSLFDAVTRPQPKTDVNPIVTAAQTAVREPQQLKEVPKNPVQPIRTQRPIESVAPNDTVRKAQESVRPKVEAAPPMLEIEKRLAAEEALKKRVRIQAQRDKSMRQAEETMTQLQKMDTSKERISQVSIDQAIENETERVPYVAPTMDLLNPPEPTKEQNEDYEYLKEVIVDTMATFNVQAEVTDIQVGPTFSLYTLKVEMPKGKSIGTILSYEDDIAMRMEKQSVRILAPIPGKNAVGIEVPNKNRSKVTFSEIVSSPTFNNSRSPLTVGLGKDLYGNVHVCNLPKFPHLLIAGATGAGKSCCINTLIVSLLYKASPEDLRLILVDPKRTEFTAYNGLPHLVLDEVICDVDKAIRALNWAINEMQRRIHFLQDNHCRDIDEYNATCERDGFKKMPKIVIVVDELADLMSLGKRGVEDAINRIARLARATGIYLVLATQRPSVDVISGTIKNNLPARIAFRVTAIPDSRTILDSAGADKLLGFGDMLFKDATTQNPIRMQGAFISNEEVNAVVQFIKDNNPANFDPAVKDAIFKEEVKEDEHERDALGNGGSKKNDNGDGLEQEILDALQVGLENPDAFSISMLQRRLGYGWPRAAKVFDKIDRMGYLGPVEKGRRKLTLTQEEYDKMVSDTSGEEEGDAQ